MMNQFLVVPMDSSATYRICIAGNMEGDYAQRRWGMTSTPVKRVGELEQTELVGGVTDQAALVGIINALYNGGHTIVSVKRLKNETGSCASG